MTILGLSFIVIAWMLQLLGKTKILKIEFVAVYLIGALLLAVDGFTQGVRGIAVLNSLSVLVAFFVILKLQKKK